MHVALTPDLEKLVASHVASGDYQSAAEVVRDALLLLDEQKRFAAMRREELRRDIAVGVDQADQGECTPFDTQALEGIKAEGRKRVADQTKTR
jgi:antitoxin ParD1/3/4